MSTFGGTLPDDRARHIAHPVVLKGVTRTYRLDAVDVPALARPAEAVVAPQAPAVPAQPTDAAVLEVQLRRGANQVTVRWPATQTAHCTQWLRELTSVVFGADARAP